VLVHVLHNRRRFTREASLLSDLLNDAGIQSVAGDNRAVSNASVCIRWGCRDWLRYSPVVEVNKAHGIECAVDKSLTFLRLEAAGVSCLVESPILPIVERELYWEHFPCVARPSRSYKGKSFFVCLDMPDVVRAFNEGAELVTKWETLDREFRVNAYVDRVAGVSKSLVYEKVRDEDAKVRWGKHWHRNSTAGYNFEYMKDAPNGLRPLAKAAIEALDLNFGGVDIGMHEDGSFMVIEVNTAPGIGPTLSGPWFAKRFAETMECALDE